MIVITGTPGVGKKNIARLLAKKISAKILSLEKVDEKKIKDIIKEENYIIASHLSHFLSPKIVDLCVVLRLNPIVLEKRLEKRKYSKKKISENIMAEILDVCLIEALEMGHKVHEINLTKMNPKDVVNEIIDVLNGKKKRKFGRVKWLNRKNFEKYLK